MCVRTLRTRFSRVLWAGQAGRVRCAEDLARALPKLVDLHLQSSLLAPAGGHARQHGSIGCIMEHIVCLYCCFSLLLESA